MHKVALHLTRSLRFDKKHPWHLNLVLLYGTMLELMGSACILIREGVAIGVPILLRSAVEANIDFTNLSADRQYGYHMQAAYLREWINILREAKSGQNPFLKDVAQRPDLGDLLAQDEKELARLKEEGFTPLQQKEKFKRANLGPVYRSVYNFLCCHSHNNIRALLARHVNIATDKADFQVDLYAQSILTDSSRMSIASAASSCPQPRRSIKFLKVTPEGKSRR